MLPWLKRRIGLAPTFLLLLRAEPLEKCRPSSPECKLSNVTKFKGHSAFKELELWVRQLSRGNTELGSPALTGVSKICASLALLGCLLSRRHGGHQWDTIRKLAGVMSPVSY